MLTPRFEVAHKDDLPGILNIWEQGLRHSFPDCEITNDLRSRFAFNFQCACSPFGFWVARSKSIVAWSSLLPAFSHPLKYGTEAEISVYVDPPDANKGVGTQILRFTLETVSSTSIECVWGFARSDNLSSIRMCQNAGMKICGVTSRKTVLLFESGEC